MSPKEAKTPTGAGQWKKQSKKKLEPVEVPSGNMAVIRRKTLDVFLKAGLIPNDLIPVVQKAMKKGVKEIKSEEIIGDASLIRGAFDLIDVIVVECVVEPKVLPVPLKEEDRDDDELYVDEVDWEDKQFIYQYALGSVSDLEDFRKQQTPDVESVPSGSDVAGSPVGSGSHR